MRRALLSLAIVAAPLAAEVYLTEQRAAGIVLKGCEVEREERKLSPQDRERLEQISGLRSFLPRYTILVGRKGGSLCGYAVVIDEIGKSEPITFMAGIDPSGKVGEVAVMEFRESRGWEVKERRFTRQFKGKRLKDPLHVNQDILNYTGATLSSEALARGVKKALALVTYYYLDRK